jgi:hypothetical protein
LAILPAFASGEAIEGTRGSRGRHVAVHLGPRLDDWRNHGNGFSANPPEFTGTGDDGVPAFVLVRDSRTFEFEGSLSERDVANDPAGGSSSGPRRRQASIRRTQAWRSPSRRSIASSPLFQNSMPSPTSRAPDALRSSPKIERSSHRTSVLARSNVSRGSAA